eukprot:Rhum_TRINITY_DN14311_c33_g1::Rhum_TRINITY_DN14311_c33_g1_i1::g.83501::m.83501
MTDAVAAEAAAPQAAATGLTGASAPAESACGPPAAKRVRLGWTTAAAAAAAAATSEQSAEPKPAEDAAGKRAGEGDACPPAEPLSRLFGSLWCAAERTPTPGVLALHNPSSSAQYRRRLASFARNPWCWCGSLWGARTSPLLCAQHGWRLAGFEGLACEHCASTLRAPASVEEEAVEQWAVLLQTAHEGWCPYRTAQCPDYGYTRFDSNMSCYGSVRKRFLGMCDALSHLERVALSPAALSVLSTRSHLMSELWTRLGEQGSWGPHEGAGDVRRTALALVVCGWTAGAEAELAPLLYRTPSEAQLKDGVLLYCPMCMAALSHTILLGGGGESGLFHPLESHMLYCPYTREQTYRGDLHSMFLCADPVGKDSLPDPMAQCTLFQKHVANAGNDGQQHQQQQQQQPPTTTTTTTAAAASSAVVPAAA